MSYKRTLQDPLGDTERTVYDASEVEAWDTARLRWLDLDHALDVYREVAQERLEECNAQIECWTPARRIDYPDEYGTFLRTRGDLKTVLWCESQVRKCLASRHWKAAVRAGIDLGIGAAKANIRKQAEPELLGNRRARSKGANRANENGADKLDHRTAS